MLLFFCNWIDLERLVERAEFLRHENPEEAIALYTRILNIPNDNDENIKVKETCTLELGQLYSERKDLASLSSLLEASRSFFTLISKTKETKIGRKLE